MRSDKRNDSRSFVNSARRAQIVEAAIDTIAEVGYAEASLSRIAVRLGISKGVISYHFAGKDDLVGEVIAHVVERARVYMQPRVEAQTGGAATLQAYIESNLDFIAANPNQLRAVIEIARARIADGRAAGAAGAGRGDTGVRILAGLLERFQAAGDFRGDFDPIVMATAIRAVIDVAPARLGDPGFDISHYTREAVTVFQLATRSAG